MDIFIHVLLAIVIYLADCSINVTRGANDVIYDKTVNAKCNVVYRANNFGSGSCKCAQDVYTTFYSNGGQKAQCGDLSKQNTGKSEAVLKRFWRRVFSKCQNSIMTNV